MAQYISKDVVNFWATDFITGNPLFFVDYAEITTPSTKANRTPIFGGQGGMQLAVFDHEKVATMQVTLPLVDFKVLASLFGSTLATGAQNVYQQDIITVGAGNTATLTKTPLAGSILAYQLVGNRDYGTVIAVGTPGSTPNTYSLAGSTLTLNVTSNPVGSRIIVIYQYATPSTTQILPLSASNFPNAMKFYFDGFLIDSVTNVSTPIKMTVYNCKIKPDFTLNFDFKNASKLALTLDLLTVADTVNGGYKYTDYILLT